MKNIMIYPITQRIPPYFKNCMDCKSDCWKTIKRCMQLDSGFYDPSQYNQLNIDVSMYQGDDLTIENFEVYGNVCKTCAKAATEAFKIKRGMH